MRQILNHLADNCDGLDDTDAIDVRLAMSIWWDEAPSMPEYILWKERVQNKAARANFPIESGYLAAVTKSSLRAALAFPTNREARDKLKKVERTWIG